MDGRLLPSGILNYKYLWNQISPQGIKMGKSVIKSKEESHISSVNRIPIILWALQCSPFTMSYKCFSCAKFFPHMLSFPLALSWEWKQHLEETTTFTSSPSKMKEKIQSYQIFHLLPSLYSYLGLEKEEIILN